MPIPPPIDPPNYNAAFAGYTVQSAIENTITKVTATFNVPNAQPAVNTSYFTAWVGMIFGLSGSDDFPYFPQLGIEALAIGTKVNWYTWTAIFYGPEYVPIIIKPGDIVTVSVEYFPIAQNCLMSMTNNTTGVSFSRYAIPNPVSGIITSGSALFDVEAPSRASIPAYTNLAPHSPIEFTNCTVRTSGVDYTISSDPTANVHGYSIGWTSGAPTISTGVTSQLTDGGSTFWVTNPSFVLAPPPPGEPTDIIVISGCRESDFNAGIMS